MQNKSFFQTMSDGFEIWVNRWSPDAEEDIKGVIELHHGLAEHSLRYDRLGSILAENGYVFNAYDVRGHGNTAQNAQSKGTGMFGKIADKKGCERVVQDLHEIIEGLKKEFEGKKVFLLGHSFGSFVSQAYIESYSEEIDGCILCGTAGPMALTVGGGKMITSIIRLIKGSSDYNKLLPKVAFGGYNKRIENPKTANDWLSVNEMNVQMYEMDNWCGIDLTTSFFDDMLTILNKIHKGKNINKISNDLPVLFIYGTEDPVGGYGKSIQKLFDIYKKKGMKNLEIKAFEGDRHEIFNEDDKEQVENTLINWVNKLV